MNHSHHAQIPLNRLAATLWIVGVCMSALVPTISSARAETLDLTKPAKQLFGAQKAASPEEPAVHGSYAKGCLGGAEALPIDGPTWQVMRLSRNRNWGHPELINTVKALAENVRTQTSWPGLLIGDISQPRGGPMLTGHASHQVGLDADIWLTPMPKRRLSPEERESLSATNVVASDWNSTDPATWTQEHYKVLKIAAETEGVHRIFVNPAIKKTLCEQAPRGDRAWLRTVRPMYGHNYHFHVRIACPEDSPNCQEQDAPPAGDGCGADLDWWFSLEARTPKPVKPATPMLLSALPAACKAVLEGK